MPSDRRTFSPVQRLVISEVLIIAVIAFSFVVFGIFYAQKPKIAEKDIENVRLNVDTYAVVPVAFQELLYYTHSKNTLLSGRTRSNPGLSGDR